MTDIISPQDYVRPGLYDDSRMQHAADMLDDDVVAELKVTVHRSGAMAVAGCIHEEAFAIACLQQAIQSVKDYHARRKMDHQINLIVPSYDTPLRG